MVKKRVRISEEAFIQEADVAPISGAEAPTPNPSKATFKRLTFSLSDDVDACIDRLSLTPRDFRCNRSDVIRAALRAFDNLSEADQIEMLRAIKHSHQ